MKMRKQIELGNMVFRNKTEAIKFVSEILWKYSCVGKRIVIEGVDREIVLDMFLGHPDFDRKFPLGLDLVGDIYVVNDGSYGGGSPHFEYEYGLGESHDISFRKCFTDGDTYRKNEIVSAFREEVTEQVQDFKKKNLVGGFGICALTEKKLRGEELAVDHDRPFKLLLGEWMELRGLEIGDIEIRHEEGDGRYGCRLLDKELAAEWRKWHLANAKLQLVDRRLNMSLGAKDKGSEKVLETTNRFKASDKGGDLK